MSAAPSEITAAVRFSDLLEQALHVWERREMDDGVFALALPLKGLDPLLQLADLDDADPFRFLWDGAPGLSLAAAGRCHHLELSGPCRQQKHEGLTPTHRQSSAKTPSHRKQQRHDRNRIHRPLDRCLPQKPTLIGSGVKGYNSLLIWHEPDSWNPLQDSYI